jgi:glycosyltransferase involved in cell wall biosynthesis
VGDAAAQFDPTDVESIAQALREVWTDEALRAALTARGHERAQAFSWDRFARSCRALYRAAAQAPLGTDDRALLAAAGVTV